MRLIRYPVLLATLGILALVFVLFSIGAVSSMEAAGLLALGQLAILYKDRMRPALFSVPFAPSQFAEMEQLIKDVKEYGSALREFPDAKRRMEREVDDCRAQLSKIQKRLLYGSVGNARPRGGVSDEAALAMFADVTLHAERCGKIEAFIRDPSVREQMLNQAKSIQGMSRAMSTSEIPLPTVYGSQLVELIAEFGVARRVMSGYPLTGGISKPPRWGTRPAFGTIAMSELVPEKKPTLTFASLEPHKLGGLVILPSEIDEASAVAMGQYLAQYGAVEFARAEDTWAFLADGTATYESVKGVCQIASENAMAITLTAGKTKPSDATLDDFRNLRRLVSTAALSGGRFYLSQTWESRLRAFNTAGDPYAFVYSPDGTARLDGFSITWTEVLQPFSTAAAASKNLAVFGNLRFWWMATRGNPRVDSSEHAYFIYDQLATRFLEELDFDYCSLDAAATLQTPAA